MSNEENEYLDGMSAAAGGEEDGGGAAATDGELGPGGETMPQISSNSQLEGNVSPTQFDDNHDNQVNNNASGTAHLGQSNNHNIDSNSNRNSPTKSPPTPRGNGNGNSSFQIQPQSQSAQYDDDEDDLAPTGDLQAKNGAAGRSAQLPDYWQQRNGGAAPAAGASGVQSGHQSRALSPSPYLDNMSENSEQPPVVPLVRSKSRPEISSAAASRYSNLSYWKARRVVFYRNGDPFFPGVELRYRPGRDVTSLDNLLDKISPKMDLPRGARYVFSMDGDRKYHLDELEDGAFYVVSSFKAFKVS
ncbi:hypothetical protein KR222_010283, partial [Zaprionus bogoriensis]